MGKNGAFQQANYQFQQTTKVTRGKKVAQRTVSGPALLRLPEVTTTAKARFPRQEKGLANKDNFLLPYITDRRGARSEDTLTKCKHGQTRQRAKSESDLPEDVDHTSRYRSPSITRDDAEDNLDGNYLTQKRQEMERLDHISRFDNELGALRERLSRMSCRSGVKNKELNSDRNKDIGNGNRHGTTMRLITRLPAIITTLANSNDTTSSSPIRQVAPENMEGEEDDSITFTREGTNPDTEFATRTNAMDFQDLSAIESVIDQTQHDPFSKCKQWLLGYCSDEYSVETGVTNHVETRK